METRNYSDNAAVVANAVGFFLMCVGVCCPNWWIMEDANARTLDVFDLFGNVLCFDNYCVPSYLSAHAQTGQSGTPGWLVAIRLLLILSLLTMFAALLTKITHIKFAHLPLIWASLGLLVASAVLTLIAVTILIHRIRMMSSIHHHPHEESTLNIQSLPLIIIFMSFPFHVISIVIITYTVCTVKQTYTPTVI